MNITRASIQSWKDDMKQYSKTKSKVPWKAPPKVHMVSNYEVISKQNQYNPILQKYTNPKIEKNIQRSEKMNSIRKIITSQRFDLKRAQKFDIITGTDKESKYNKITKDLQRPYKPSADYFRKSYEKKEEKKTGKATHLNRILRKNKKYMNIPSTEASGKENIHENNGRYFKTEDSILKSNKQKTIHAKGLEVQNKLKSNEETRRDNTSRYTYYGDHYMNKSSQSSYVSQTQNYSQQPYTNNSLNNKYNDNNKSSSNLARYTQEKGGITYTVYKTRYSPSTTHENAYSTSYSKIKDIKAGAIRANPITVQEQMARDNNEYDQYKNKRPPPLEVHRFNPVKIVNPEIRFIDNGLLITHPVEVKTPPPPMYDENESEEEIAKFNPELYASSSSSEEESSNLNYFANSKGKRKNTKEKILKTYEYSGKKLEEVLKLPKIEEGHNRGLDLYREKKEGKNELISNKSRMSKYERMNNHKEIGKRNAVGETKNHKNTPFSYNKPNKTPVIINPPTRVIKTGGFSRFISNFNQK